MKPKMLFLSAVLVLASCGGDPLPQPKPLPADAYSDAGVTTSALAVGQFCREATDPGGCLNGGNPIASDQAIVSHCPGGAGTDRVTIELTQLISGQGVTWFDAIRTPSRFTSEYKSTWALEGTPVVGGSAYLPMSEGYGILYLSQNVAMTMRRSYDGLGAPVTLLAGNLQYWPADATHHHGTWHAWISSTGNDSLGICSDIAVSWSPTS